MKRTNEAIYVNLACGTVYINNEQWLNFDFNAQSDFIKKVNLLGKLPLDTQSVSAVYCSHFIEHIPKEEIIFFLCEAHRILVKGGVARFVTPDLEEMCDEFLFQRRNGEHEKADFVILEMIDQLVRRKSGGELGSLYKKLHSNPNENDLIAYIYHRTGEDLFNGTFSTFKKHIIRRISINKIIMKLSTIYCRLLTLLLPSAFRKQNVSFCSIGEKHAWLYDFYTLSKELKAAGFTSVQRMTATSSNIECFPFYPLDINADNLPRKGKESMYLEAIKQ